MMLYKHFISYIKMWSLSVCYGGRPNCHKGIIDILFEFFSVLGYSCCRTIDILLTYRHILSNISCIDALVL